MTLPHVDRCARHMIMFVLSLRCSERTRQEYHHKLQGESHAIVHRSVILASGVLGSSSALTKSTYIFKRHQPFQYTGSKVAHP